MDARTGTFSCPLSRIGERSFAGVNQMHCRVFSDTQLLGSVTQPSRLWYLGNSAMSDLQHTRRLTALAHIAGIFVYCLNTNNLRHCHQLCDVSSGSVGNLSRAAAIQQGRIRNAK